MLQLKVVCTMLLINVATSIETPEKASNITSYDPGKLLAKIFNSNTTIASRQNGYGLVFENQADPESDDNHGKYGLITFEENNKRLKFEDDSQNPDDNYSPLQFQKDGLENADRKPYKPLKFEDKDLIRNQETFQDDNNINLNNKRKKRRRRRKPKNGLQNYPGTSQGYPGEFPTPGFGPNPYPVNPGLAANPNVNPGYPGPIPLRRRRRPKPSLAADAFTAITEALTSIALYDDYQCVPRLLCEAAGGESLGSNGVLNSIAGIQPLLSLLSAYNGISSSPLFVFGRAVFLGMTSRGNTGTCRYAYSQCPTDPEQLIHYLNNHNGGFFRFFNAPLPNQNLEQFYNHLGQNGQYEQQHLGQQNYAHDYDQNQSNFPNYQQGQGNYGLYQNQQPGQQNYGYHNPGQNTGQYGQNYGANYGYNTYGSNVRFKAASASIEKRIQNKPIKDDVDNFEELDSVNTKWLFPEQIETNINYDNNERDREALKFPEELQKYDDKRDFKRKGKSILFPENQYNYNAYSNKNYHKDFNKEQTDRPYYQNNYNYNQNVVNANIYKQTTTSPFNENGYYYDHKHKFYVKNENNVANYNNPYNKNQVSYNNRDQNQVTYTNYYNKGQTQGSYVNYNRYASSTVKDDGLQIVYIVRGNGDPNRPEIVKVRPGQSPY